MTTKQGAGQQALKADALPLVFTAVLASLMARNGASLRDKTVLDAIGAVRQALESELVAHEPQAVAAALESYRQKPKKIGWTRMFADRSVNLDDPGMVAFANLAKAAFWRTPLISGSLKGLKALDLSRFIAGPLCAIRLTDMGPA